jgi:hypothetical protein
MRFLLPLIFLAGFANAQTVHRQIAAVRDSLAPIIDGKLDDAAWKKAPVATGFTQLEQHPGQPSVQPTFVRVIYDDDALYIGAFMKEVARDSVLHQYSQRDSWDNTDIFCVGLDTYNDNINAFLFVVTAAGVQGDVRASALGEDASWNAVWESRAIVSDSGWTAEMRIPYSALRFSKEKVQTWGVNFMRQIRRLREESWWSPIDPKQSNVTAQYGDLTGIRDIEAPLRLSLAPYVSAYAEHYPYNEPGHSNWNHIFNAGMDLKYGLSESFTLDMTLVPDFGQVQSDNRVLNLSPFEVRYDEYRSFFTEGTELFNKGDLFYSRRIGGEPMGYYDVDSQLGANEKILTNPQKSQLYNATKITGRTKHDLGIGFFNAITAPTYATIRDTTTDAQRRILTQPLTNYNEVVFDQALKNNSYVSFINTSVIRNGSAYDANVSEVEYDIHNKKNNFSVQGWAAASAKAFPGDSIVSGKTFGLNFGKISGNFLARYESSYFDNRYDPNDMGYLTFGNFYSQHAVFEYNMYQPFWKVNNLFNSVDIEYSRNVVPSGFWNFAINGRTITTLTKSFMTTGLFYTIEPITTYDWFEPRTPGRFYTYPIDWALRGFISSDYRKVLAIDASFGYHWYSDPGRFFTYIEFSPRVRASDRLMFIWSSEQVDTRNDIGYVDGANDSIWFGRRRLRTLTNVLTATYIFTPRMSLSFRMRHYWSKAEYNRYSFLNLDGTLTTDPNYTIDHNVNFDAFNIDMVYTWQFQPGSEMSIVWKNAILASGTVQPDYVSDVRHTFDSPQNNSLSIRVLYYLDYQQLRRKKS